MLAYNSNHEVVELKNFVGLRGSLKVWQTRAALALEVFEREGLDARVLGGALAKHVS